MRLIQPTGILSSIRYFRAENSDALASVFSRGRLRSMRGFLRERKLILDGGDLTLNIDLILRSVRVLIGSIILLTILTAILIPQVLPVSGNSFVNAKLEWIRTPIEGELDFADVRVGDKITQGLVLGTVTNQRADDFFLNQLSSEKSALDSVLFALDKRREDFVVRRQELTIKAKESLIDLEEKTGIRLALIENELFMANKELSSVDARLARYKKVNADYEGDELFAVVSRSQIELLADRKMELKTLLSSRQKTMSLLESKLKSAMSGSFVSEDTPLEQQQLMDVAQSLIGIESEISSLQLKSETLSTQIESRNQYLQKHTRYQLVAGANGTVWDIGFPDGSYVNHGDSVVAIADTDTISVEGIFHQRYLDNIKVGDPATIDLMGSRKRFRGEVAEVKIRDQVKSADLSAFNLDSPESNEFKIVVSFDRDENKDVYIGQRAKLIINKSASSIIPAVLLFFNR